MLCGMPPSREELARIAAMRERFLDDERGPAAQRDYWRDPADLQAYDLVLAARIGWKWDAALAECRARGFLPPPDATVLDFGCGTGIAARRFVAAFGARGVRCHDRSVPAMEFAVRAFAAAAPGVAVQAQPDVAGLAPDVLLVSHVLGELDERGLASLRELIGRAARVVVVEPGNRTTARRLAALRDELLETFRIVAPCPHAARCPALATDADWCHFFAPPPPEVFTDGDWVRTARAVGIDLRALPYAFVVLERRDGARPAAPAATGNRVLGRPAIGPRAATVRVCTGPGLREIAVAKREWPELWRMLRKQPETVRTLPPELLR